MLRLCQPLSSRRLCPITLACAMALPGIFTGVCRAQDAGTAMPLPNWKADGGQRGRLVVFGLPTGTSTPATATGAPIAPAPASADPAMAAPSTPAPDATAAAASPGAATAPAETAAPAVPDIGMPVGVVAPSTITPQEKQMRDDVDAYFHYAWVGRYDLAAQFGQKVLDETDDAKKLIPVLESTAHRHDAHMTYIAQLMQFDNQKDAKEVTDKLLAKVNAGTLQRASDLTIVGQTIRDMSANERAYQNHLPNLRKSGELAVPIIIEFLRMEDDLHKPYRSTARLALKDLGRLAVNPLLAATQTRDTNLSLTIVDTLGNIGYPEAQPYLTDIVNDSSRPQGVREAARLAISRLHNRDMTTSDGAQMFYNLAGQFYYEKSDIAQVMDVVHDDAAHPAEMANYWQWSEDKGLLRQQVPAAIFGDLMAMRCTEKALSMRGNLAPAISLWLAADNKREADLPKGQTDPINAGQPPAHFYNVSAGATHLGEALTRALNDRNVAVALKLTHSLGQIIGRSSLDSAASGPLIRALSSSNKQVRFEAACALGASLPEKSFGSQDQVVPLLVEAVGSSGKGNVICLGHDQDDANALQVEIKKLGYITAATSSASDAVVQAGQMPGVDAVVVSSKVTDSEVRQLVSVTPRSTRLSQAPDIILRETATGALADQTLGNNLISIAVAAQGDALAQAIEAGRDKAGAMPMSEEDVSNYAMRSAQVLDDIALHQGGVLNITHNEQNLVPVLSSPNGDLAMAVGRVLSHLPSQAAQRGLATRALDPQTPGPVKISLYRSLALSAKNHGNQLDGQQIKQLGVEIDGAKEDELRSAAAEARGALNLPTDQATQLILSQVR